MKFPHPVDYDYFLSVLDKAETGPLVTEKDWDRQFIYKTIRRLIEEFDIAWDYDSFSVPTDDAHADRLYEAGMALAVESGVFCRDTGRRMTWSREELEKVLAAVPLEVVHGQGDDAVTVHKRNPDEDSPVRVIGGPYGVPIEEEYFYPLTVSYVQEKSLDFYEGASLQTTHGRAIRSNAPLGAVANWQEVEATLRAIKAVGRPGMTIGAAHSEPSAIGTLTASSHNGLRPTDWNHTSFTSELKVSYQDLLRATHWVHTGSVVHNLYNPIYGGFAGGKEGNAIVSVAGMILMRACLHGDTFNPGNSHAHWSCSTFPDIILSNALTMLALSRNTNLLVSSFARPVAGPLVKDIFYEVAAMHVACVPCGVSIVKGVQTATGRFTGHCTALECRFMADVTHAAEKLTRKEADPIVRKLIDYYKDGQGEMKIGVHFKDAYNLDTLQPTPEWEGMYEEALKEMKDLGLPL